MRRWPSPSWPPSTVAILETLRRLVTEHPGLATARIVGEPGGCGSGTTSRTLLHIATDWPGHFPQAAAAVRLLIDAGADVDARFAGTHAETPLHWAASSDDVAVLDVLVDRGANIEADGGVIGSGTPIADAVAFGQWNAARRLLARGAATSLWQAAALGLLDRIEALCAMDPPPAEVTKAFWCACHGDQRAAAEYLLARGADPGWVGYDHLTPAQAARRSGADDLAVWVESRPSR